MKFFLENKVVKKVGKGQKRHSSNYFLHLIGSYFVLTVDSTGIYCYKLTTDHEYWCFSISLSSFFYFLSLVMKMRVYGREFDC